MEILSQDQQALTTMHARQSERRCICFFVHAICASQIRCVQCGHRDTRHAIGKHWSAMSSYVSHHKTLCGGEWVYKCVCFNRINSYIVRSFFSRPNSNTSPAAGMSNDVCGQSRAEGAPRTRSEWHRVACLLYVCISNNDEPPEMSLIRTRREQNVTCNNARF